MKIATLGPRGTYSVQVTQAYDQKAELAYGNTVQEVIAMVADDHAEQGVIPLENSIHGIVAESLDGLAARAELTITQELIFDIHHALCAVNPTIVPDDVRTIYSHPQALGQCSNYIIQHYPTVQIVTTASTAAGLQTIAGQQDAQALAIGSAFAARQYGLTVIAQGIEDEPDNQTRFVVFSKQTAEAPLPFTLAALIPEADRPGLLYDILSIFKQHEINLSQIESRPSRTKLGSYVFYVRLEMAGNDSRLAAIVEASENLHIAVRKMSA